MTTPAASAASADEDAADDDADGGWAEPVVGATDDMDDMDDVDDVADDRSPAPPPSVASPPPQPLVASTSPPQSSPASAARRTRRSIRPLTRPLLASVQRQRRRRADRAAGPGVVRLDRVHQHHEHQAAGDLAQQRRRLSLVLAITVTVLLVEVVGAALSGSLALLADAGHGLTDAAGLALALVATAFAQRPATPRRTWGYRRAEVLGAAAQAAVLLAVGVYVLVEAVRRLADPPEVASGAMLVFGAVGLAGNLVGIAVLAGSRSQSMNMRAAFLEVVNDALGSLAVLVAAVCIATLGWTRADAVASLAIGLLILPRTWLLLRETVDVLLESTPRGLDLDALRARLLAMDHVRGVHDLHATQVAANLPVLTAHVVVEDLCFHDAHLPALLDEMQRCLADEYDVEHSTFQFEREVHAEHEHSTHP
jgi:cobalt-zinc-cadmium efflux system protein